MRKTPGCLALLFSVAATSFGQTPTGTIEVVTETVLGDAVAGASVRIVELATGRILELLITHKVSRLLV